jgi:hypothetical protein
MGMIMDYDVCLLTGNNTVVTEPGVCVAMLDTQSLLVEIIEMSRLYLVRALKCSEITARLTLQDGQITPHYDIPKTVDCEKATQQVRWATAHYGRLYMARLKDYLEA